MPATDRLGPLLARGPALLDAAMGTRLIARGLDLAREDPSAWALDRPDEVLRLHRLDVLAGADAVLTNTFGANRAWLAWRGLPDRARAINREAARLARIAAGPDRPVLGSIGPTASDDPAALREQAEALAEGGIDALVLETHRPDQALRALAELARSPGLPVLASLYRWPDPARDAARALADSGAVAVGANCLAGMSVAVRLARRLREATDLPILIKPSVAGPTRSAPALFARAVPRLLAGGVGLLGGCCGTTEAHVRALREALDAWRPDPLRL